jgi:restriction system protein
MSKVLLVRSPAPLTKLNLAGYGWGEINFSEFSQFNELLSYVEEQEIEIGRHKNQMSRFFNIKEGDVLVVPVYRAIIIGIAQGDKSYGEGVSMVITG